MLFWMLMIIAVLGATLAQALLPGWAMFGQARFPVLLGLVLYYALNHKSWIVILVAFVAGMLQDGLSLVPLGYSALLFCVVASVAGRYRRLVLSEAVVTAAFFGGISSLLMTLFLFLLLNHSGTISCSGSLAFLRIVGSGILGTITVPAVFLIMTHLHHELELSGEEDTDVRA
jgi:rod shape-determining protein MreD